MANLTDNTGYSMPANMTDNSTVAPVGAHGGFPVPRDIQIGVTILAVIVIILAMIGNTLVIYIVFTVNHMRSSTNSLIANMAFADLLMAIDIPYILKWVYVWDKWFGTFMGSVLCKFFHSAQVGSIAASVFSLVAISLDRSFAILFPMRTIMTRNVVRFAIAIIWLCALALTVPLMIASENIQQEGTEFHICLENWSPITARTTYNTFLFTTAYIIPLSIIAIVYCLAGLRLWSRKLPGQRNLMAHKKAQASSRRATAMLITVVIIFALSWLPFQALEMIRVFNQQLLHTIPLEVHFVIPWFGYCNSAINPILYVIFSENYRREFYRILCRGPSRQERYRNTIVVEPKHNSNDAPVTSELLRRKYTAPKAQRRSERQERIRKSRDTMSPKLNKTCQDQRSYRGSPGTLRGAPVPPPVLRDVVSRHST
ncbi:Somatostatin receptor type 5 [Desmophyllum pertusum]|uniref:Somatostatin receptor type 5 n=1 Tax=Desmophyllum pertusum TaxID=174260 RepID=A0A9X0CHQ9_9CNID|nr:Somatostatin receptor type 5 [Desmophyllum pertusum]